MFVEFDSAYRPAFFRSPSHLLMPRSLLEGTGSGGPFQTHLGSIEVSKGSTTIWDAGGSDDWAPGPLVVYAGAPFDLGMATTDRASGLVRREAELDARLRELSDQMIEDHGCELDAQSLSGLRHFLRANNWVRDPDLTSDSHGHVVASWRKGDQSASLRFIDTDHFHYAMAVQTAEGGSRPWGTTSRMAFLSERPEARSILG